MKIPINIRIVSSGPRIAGGHEQILVEGQSLDGGVIFQFETNRGALAESLALHARQGIATPGDLRYLDIETQDPVDAATATQHAPCTKGKTIQI